MRLELLSASLDHTTGEPVWRFRDERGHRVALHGAARFDEIQRDVIRGNDPRRPLACEFRYYADPNQVRVSHGARVEVMQ